MEQRDKLARDDSWTKALLFGLGSAAGVWLLASAVRGIGNGSFRDRSVVITGGSRGLGLVLARRFAREGARVAILARDTRELGEAEKQLAEISAQILALKCDITDVQQVQNAMSAVAARFGGIDVLVNNAGVMRVGPFESSDESDFRMAMDVHFWGTLHCTREALRYLKQSEFPRLVNIASIGGLISVPHITPYCASKFAVVGLSRGLRSELSKEGIKVTTVCPGTMRTGSAVRSAEFKGDQEKEFRWFALGGSLPGISMSAERAAQKIIEGARRGQAELVLSMPAVIAAKTQALAPGLFASLMTFVDKSLLPAAAPQGEAQAASRIRRSSWLDRLSSLSHQSAMRNNEPT